MSEVPLYISDGVVFVEGVVSAPATWTCSRNVQRFRGGLVFKAHRLVYHLTLGLSVITKQDKSVTTT